MLTMIAFLMLAALVAAWIVAPNTATESMPMAMPETEIAPTRQSPEPSASPA